MPFCDSCGEYFSPDQGSERTRTHTEVTGQVAWSRVELASYCPRCTKGHDGMSRWLGWALTLLVLAILALALIGR